MELSEIASIAGKGGLFKITKPTRSGVIVETLDERKQKMVASADNRISILKEISIYTTDQEGSKPLEDVLKKIHQEFEGDPGVNSSSNPEELKAFMKHIVPEYDMDRVYVSDIKKLVSWYTILYKQAPELLTAAEVKEEKKEKPDKKKSDKEPKKAEKVSKDEINKDEITEKSPKADKATKKKGK